jgi:hypothetical protein
MGFEEAGGRRRVMHQFSSGPDGARDEIAAAIGACVVQSAFNAAGTERAFKRTYPGVCRGRGQVFVTAFAVGFEGQHPRSPFHLVID